MAKNISQKYNITLTEKKKQDNRWLKALHEQRET